jgi:hypothetical protein
MKNGTPRQSPDLRTALEQPSDREQELLSQRVKILEQRLLILKKYDRSTQRKTRRPRPAKSRHRVVAR